MLQYVKPVQKGFVFSPVFYWFFRDDILSGFHLIKSSLLHLDAGF